MRSFLTPVASLRTSLQEEGGRPIIWLRARHCRQSNDTSVCIFVSSISLCLLGNYLTTISIGSIYKGVIIRNDRYMGTVSDCTKRVERGNSYEVWEGFGPYAGWKWEVVMKFQHDEEYPVDAKWGCYVTNEANPEGYYEEVFVRDVKRSARCRFSRCKKKSVPITNAWKVSSRVIAPKE